MLISTIVAVIIILLSTFPSGFMFALALLRKTGLHIFEVVVVGFILGFVGPAILTWMESYLIDYIHFFSFSLALFEINSVALIIISFLICWKQGVFKEFKQEFLTPQNVKQRKRSGTSNTGNPHRWVWAILILIMLSTFATRMLSIGITPQFFEFDPYFDMMDTSYILTYGQQLLLDPSAWPAIPAGTNHRIEPLIPYVEAFWYSLSNAIGPNFPSLNITMLSNVSGVYPPIAAALLVFAIFMIVYHEYNEYLGLIAAGLTATMPVLISTFIAGEQLVEPWGIFALFFFVAAYMLAIKNPSNKRLAIFAGIAFATNFLGAHYYTVTTGVLVLYILLQGLLNLLRNETSKDFYKMNAIMIAVIAIFYIIYLPYSSTLQNRIPTVLGVPLTLSGPIVALIGVALLDYLPRFLQQRKIIFKELTIRVRLAWLAMMLILALLLIAFTPVGTPIKGYLSLSTKFTTPSSPLFMTVEEYIPTGLSYNFGANGFGVLGSNIAGQPVLVWLICAIAFILIAVSILLRRSKTGILYMAIAIPLMIAGFSEVKYLPHFGVAYILLFIICIGELIYYAENNFKLKWFTREQEAAFESAEIIPSDAQTTQAKYGYLVPIFIAIGLFFLSGIIALVYLGYLGIKKTYNEKNSYIWGAFAIAALLILGGAVFGSPVLVYGEGATYIDAINAGLIVSANPTMGCNTLSNTGDSLGFTLYCNTIPQYWLNAMAWLRQNVGPYNARVLAWWDYGDWINWFGNSNAFLRGDNANATEDYATAAQYVLSSQEGVTPQTLANFMNTNQSKYVLFDQDLIGKWGAVDFLACIYSGGTSQAFAIASGQEQSPPVPYQLGTSKCELEHDPQYTLIPYGVLEGNESLVPPTLDVYCSISNSTTQYVSAPLVNATALSNTTVCISTTPSNNGALQVYDENGTKLNAVVQLSDSAGIVGLNVDGYDVPYVEFMMIYLPNGPNGTITDAPSYFYTSNYYKGFFLGDLPGFTEVYPSNAVGVNLVNGTYSVRIYELNNFTGTLPSVPPKPPWVSNNYTIP